MSQKPEWEQTDIQAGNEHKIVFGRRKPADKVMSAWDWLVLLLPIIGLLIGKEILIK